MRAFGKYKHKKAYSKLLFACCLFYMFNIALKLSYGVQMVAIIDDFGTTNSQVAVGLTIYYVIYAVVQVALAFIITRINIRRLLIYTTILTCISFSFIGVCNELWQLCLLYSVNGIFHAGAWGTISYIFGKNLPGETLSFANKIITNCFAIGNALSYLVSSIFIHYLSWKFTFVFFSVLYLLSMLYMLIQTNKTEKLLQVEKEDDVVVVDDIHKGYCIPKEKKFNVVGVVILLCVISFVANNLAYGINNWIPSLLTDEHNFPMSLSIFISLFMPIVSVFANYFAMGIFDRKGKILSVTNVIGLMSIALLGVMVFLYDWNLIFAILMSAGLRFITTSYLAGYGGYTMMKFKYHINTGTANLIINSAASIGAGVGPLLTGLILDVFDWKAYYIFLIMLCSIGVIIGVIGSLVIKKKKNIVGYI